MGATKAREGSKLPDWVPASDIDWEKAFKKHIPVHHDHTRLLELVNTYSISDTLSNHHCFISVSKAARDVKVFAQGMTSWSAFQNNSHKWPLTINRDQWAVTVLLASCKAGRNQKPLTLTNTLQQANFIQYSRGHIEITNLEGLSKISCECYATVKLQYNRLLRPRYPL